eukprot:g7423.t1
MLMMKRRKLMDFLLTNGFEDGTVNSKKVTWKICSTYPLHEAVRQKNVEIVDLLLAFGADVRLTDWPSGRTAYSLANHEVREVFERTG